MKHVRVTLTAGGREGEIHPMYDVMVNADFVDYGTAMHWNFTGDELGIMHYVQGDVDAYREAAESAPEVIDFELVPVDDAFYAYVQDRTTPELREMFGAITNGSVIAVPPIEYHEDGTVTFSLLGPGDDIQAAIDAVPDPVRVTVEEVGGMTGTPGVAEALLSDRQREAIEAAIDLGYYEIPREADHEAVADAIGCAPSTAAEHLRKAESKVLRATFD
ncbi:helix-turn-helix domain-containing protein [Halobacteriales archaeon Cl-PHB]